MRRPRLLVALALCLGLASTGTQAFGDSVGSSRSAAADVRAPVSSALPHLTARVGANAVPGPGTTPPNPAFTSPNWSGYGVLGAAGQFTSVSTGWTQPRIDYSVPGAVSMWAGLDGLIGDADDHVEQTGTTAIVVNGLPTYYAWYEMYPQPAIRLPDAVQPGDNMYSTVTYANGQYTLYLRDQTASWSETRTMAGTFPNSSAEAILEAPGDPTLPLTQFGFAGFYGTTINGVALPAWNPLSVDMLDNNGGGQAHTSGLDAQGYFTVTDGAANALAGHPHIVHDGANALLHLSTPAPAGGTAITSYLGQAALTDPAVTTLPGGGFQAAYEGSTPAGARLMIAGAAFTFNAQLGMALHTRPAIAALPDGSYEVVFQADTGHLWKYSLAAGGSDMGYQMAPGTSPSITATPGGGWEVAFQGNDGTLWEAGDSRWPTGLAMAPGTSPSITAVSSGGFEVAFQDRAGYYCDINLLAGVCPNARPMAAGTSPAITALTGGGYEAAFQASSGLLWTVGTGLTWNTTLGMKAGTSPTIIADADLLFQAAFQANTGQLWVVDPHRGGVSQGIAASGSPGMAP